MTPNDKLPKKTHKRIVADATKWSEMQYGHDDVNKDYLEGALHEAKIAHALATVLQEFVSKHEAGLLPDRFVYDKAIKILNDGK